MVSAKHVDIELRDGHQKRIKLTNESSNGDLSSDWVAGKWLKDLIPRVNLKQNTTHYAVENKWSHETNFMVKGSDLLGDKPWLGLTEFAYEERAVRETLYWTWWDDIPEHYKQAINAAKHNGDPKNNRYNYEGNDEERSKTIKRFIRVEVLNKYSGGTLRSTQVLAAVSTTRQTRRSTWGSSSSGYTTRTTTTLYIKDILTDKVVKSDIDLNDVRD